MKIDAFKTLAFQTLTSPIDPGLDPLRVVHAQRSVTLHPRGTDADLADPPRGPPPPVLPARAAALLTERARLDAELAARIAARTTR